MALRGFPTIFVLKSEMRIGLSAHPRVKRQIDRLTDWLTEGLWDCRTALLHIPSTDWPTQHEIPIYNLIEHRTTKATARRRQYVFGYVVESRCKNEKRKRFFFDFFWGGSNANVHGGTPCQRSQQRRRKLACACVRSCLCVCVPLSSYILNIYHLLPFTVNIYSVCLWLPDCPLSLGRTLSLSLTLTLFYSPASVNAVCRLRLVLAALSIATIATFVTTIGSKVLPLSANVIVPDIVAVASVSTVVIIRPSPRPHLKPSAVALPAASVVIAPCVEHRQDIFIRRRLPGWQAHGAACIILRCSLHSGRPTSRVSIWPGIHVVPKRIQQAIHTGENKLDYCSLIYIGVGLLKDAL